MDRQVRQALGPEALGIFHQGVDLLSCHACLSLGVDAADRAAFLKSALENHKFAVLHHVGNIL